MAVWHFVIFQVVLFLVASIAAPSEDKGPVSQDGVIGMMVPENCKDKSICKSVEDEKPELKTNNATVKHPRSELANIDSESILSPESDWDNCPYITKKELLYLFYTAKGEVELAVQTALMRQYVTTVRCAHEYIPEAQRGKEECFQHLGLYSMGIRSTCKTTYGRRSVFYYNPTDTKIVMRTISIPVACSCVLSNNF